MPTTFALRQVFTTQPTVCVTDASGNGIEGKRVIAQVWFRSGQIVGSGEIEYEPTDLTVPRQKALTGAVSEETGSDGCVTFTELGTSQTGLNGLFSISMSMLVGAGKAAGQTREEMKMADTEAEGRQARQRRA